MTNETETKETTDNIQNTAGELDSLVDITALSPTNSSAPDSSAQRIAELERELQQERVEKGRLRQTSDELRQLKEEIAKLKAENATLKQKRPTDYLTDAERGQLDSEQLAVIDKVVQGRVGDMSAAQRAETERLREELAKRDKSMAATAAAQFTAEVERLVPGLSTAVNERNAEWKKWTSSPRRAASVAAAFKSRDAATVAEFLQEFAQSVGIQTSGNGTRPATSFSPRGGNHPASTSGDTTTYTLDEFNKALRGASEDFHAGRISTDEYRAIKRKFDTALAEGRIANR